MRTVLRSFSVASTLLAFVACAPKPAPPPSAEETPPTRVVKAERVADPAACENLGTPPPATQFPAGFDYPQPSSKIQSWVTPGQGPRVRFHAFCVFAGLNQPANASKDPTWRTFGTSTQAFPYQYNPWKPSAAYSASGSTDDSPAAPEVFRPVTLNAKNVANAQVGGAGAINFPPPIYGVNPAIVKNPAYKPCLQPIPKTNPPLYALKDGVNFESNGDIMVAAVSYNQAALSNIQMKGLADASKLDALLPGKTSPSTSIQPFPSTSIVLKVMLWPVSGGGPTWTSVTALPIWDWEKNPPGSPADGQYAGYEMQKFWTRAVAISSGPPGPAEQKRVQFLYGVLDPNGKPLGPNTYDSAERVTLDRFYSKKYTSTDLGALSTCDRAILDASAYWAYNRAFQAGDSLALVAMHVMTKEPQSAWTFQSAWWHPDALACSNPASNRYCGHRPNSVPGGDQIYKNYMITTTYGTTQQQGSTNYYVPPGTVGRAWPVAYNPYIELAASHPITTNCMNCHSRAAWPPDTPDTKPDRGRSSSYLQASPANPNALETFQGSNKIFNGLALVDSMWAVSDRAGYPKSAATAPEEDHP